MTRPDDLNQALIEWTGAHGLPDFRAVNDEDFAPAFRYAMAQHLAELDCIASNPDRADFENTIVAFEKSGDALGKVEALFWHRAGTAGTPVIQALEREIGPQLARHSAAIYMDEKLFARIDELYQKTDQLNLTSEQARVLELHHKRFIKQGAALKADAKLRLAEIDQRLAFLAAQFGQNVLADENNWTLILDAEEDLAGLPDNLVDAMAEAATGHGNEGKHAVTLSRSIIEPFLSSSSRADLREIAFKAWSMRGQNPGETNNSGVISETLSLRHERAGLLGYASFADLKLDGTMAKSASAVNGLLGKVWAAAKTSAADHYAQLQQLAVREGHNEPLKASDWRYYTNLLREEKFDLDEGLLKPYFQLQNMIEAAFDVAGKLFGLSFKERTDIVGPHLDARVFEVRNRDGKVSGIFIGDYFARSAKRSGAWMSQLQYQHGLDGGQIPLIMNVMNFAKPAKGSPALLSLDDARTLFHEFGHALHGLLSRVTYPSIAGTSVSRDFVELPSQLYEHWLTVPEVLQKHARHMSTGEPIPEDMLNKVLASRSFNAGFNAVEFTSSAIVDMRFHEQSADTQILSDPLKFEQDVLASLTMPDAITMRHRSPHFLHVFYGDGYAAGYYSYMWSEVLDADAFQAFEETGDVFDTRLAEKLEREIYSSGNSVDPEAAYTAFRGQLPTPEAMLKKRGLAA